MDTVLEVLKRAERSLNGRSPQAVIDEGDWDFGDWSRCTCGHIYSAVVGKVTAGITASGVLEIPDEYYAESFGISPESEPPAYAVLPAQLRALISEGECKLYIQTLGAIAEANGLSGDTDLASVVSSGTLDLAIAEANGLGDTDLDHCRKWYGDSGEEQLLLTARRMVQNTIAALTAQYEQDRAVVAGGVPVEALH